MIAWYIHDHGHGHRTRAAAMAQFVGRPVLHLSRLAPPPTWPGPHVRFGTDVPPGTPIDPTANGRLHWAPVSSVTSRHANDVSKALQEYAVHTLVVDVSVEVAVLARLHGVRVVVVAQRGRRDDPAHALAFDLADRILAPWPAQAGTDAWSDERRRRTSFVGGVSRFDGRHPSPSQRRTVVVMLGSGGHDVSMDELAAAARATPDWCWTVLGPVPGRSKHLPDNLRALDWVADPFPHLVAAAVVVTHAGMNAIAEVAAARRPAIVLPMDRPFDEQHSTGRAIADMDLADVLDAWPVADAWPGLLTTADRRSGTDWAAWSDGGGAARAAAVVRVVADGTD